MGIRGPLPRHATAQPAAPTNPLPPPEWLPPAARDVWMETEPRLRASGRLLAEHSEVFGQWCAAAAELRGLVRRVEAEGSVATGPHGATPSAAHTAASRLRTNLLTLGKALGLDPLSAARLETMPRPAAQQASAVQLWRERWGADGSTGRSAPPCEAARPVERHGDNAEHGGR